jgi:hypothetical protein
MIEGRVEGLKTFREVIPNEKIYEILRRRRYGTKRIF